MKESNLVMNPNSGKVTIVTILAWSQKYRYTGLQIYLDKYMISYNNLNLTSRVSKG